MNMSKSGDGEFVAYYGKENEWKLYRQSDGSIVGYRSMYDKHGDPTKVDRIVTNTSDYNEFYRFVDKYPEQKRTRYNPHKDPNQTRIE